MLIFFLSVEVLAILEFDKYPAPFCILLFEFGKSFLPLPQSQVLLLNLFAQVMGLRALILWADNLSISEFDGNSSSSLGSGPRYQILSHVFARCASQKTHGHMGHARIARESVTQIIYLGPQPNHHHLLLLLLLLLLLFLLSNMKEEVSNLNITCDIPNN